MIRSNAWILSSAPLNEPLFPGFMEGLSELSSAPIFIYKDTKPESCECGPPPPPYNCLGTDFMEPKSRPWPESRSFDWTFVWGGWDDAHVYNGPWPSFYKSTDMQEIKETITNSLDGTEFVEFKVVLGGTNAPVTNITVKVASSTNSYRILGGPEVESFRVMEETKTTYTTNYYLGTNSFVFSKLNGLGGPCEQLLGAELEIPIRDDVSADVDIAYFVEFDPDKNMDSYGDGPPPTKPGDRFKKAGWYFNSFTNYATIPAGTPASGVVTVDVSQIFRQAITAPGFKEKNMLGFIIYSTNLNGAVAHVPVKSVRLSVRYKPGYAVDPYWSGPNLLVWIGKQLQNRKSVGMVYDYDRQKIVLFGGIDGKDVFSDTYEGAITYTTKGEPHTITWTYINSPASPPARWGHSMVYDAHNKRVVMFGGFDSEHRPLNDLWVYRLSTSESQTTNAAGTNSVVTVTNSAEWKKIVNFQDTQRPQPRGGASLVYYGDYDYNRGIGPYFVSANKQKVVLFGGTDGKTYFNDTWVFDDGGSIFSLSSFTNISGSVSNRDRWVLVNPVGEQSQGPSPRAFASMVWAQNGRSSPNPTGSREYRANAITDDVEPEQPKGAKPAVYLFGGRCGTLPTGKDTDFDMVDDGVEYELGGPRAGRDPRINRLVQPDQTNETIPFAYNKVGSMPIAAVPRAAIANFESLNNVDGIYATHYGLPSETHVEGDRTQRDESTPAFDDRRGIDAMRVDQNQLWFHRYGGEDPFDPRDVWEVGVPNKPGLDSNAVPPYAYSGRWCYGTSLRGPYPNDAIMELYSPLMDLRMANPNSTATN